MLMRLSGVCLILAALCVALGEFFLSPQRPLDSFGEIGLAYAIAGIMAVGGLAVLLFSGGPHPAEEEYESPGLHLVG